MDRPPRRADNTTATPPTDANLWLSPRRLRRYEAAKGVGAVLFASLFFVWAMASWPQRLPTLIATPLVLITFWVTVTSVVRDRQRSVGRQLRITSHAMHLTLPGAAIRVPWGDVHSARWLDEESSSQGLWLYGAAGQPLAHIDRAFLADQSEARAFLGWARQRASLRFPVAWE